MPKKLGVGVEAQYTVLLKYIVNNYNNLRYSIPSIEATWVTHRWATRVFSFILAVTEENYYLAFKCYI